jgi:hypothetical protein
MPVRHRSRGERVRQSMRVDFEIEIGALPPRFFGSLPSTSVTIYTAQSPETVID